MYKSEEQRLKSVFLKFYHEVTKTTTLLMHLIVGIETAYNNQHQVGKGVNFTPPNVSDIDIFPSLIGCNFEDLLGHEGEAEQMAYKAWVLQIYNNIWESCSRSEFSNTSEDPRAIPWEMDAMGDFRHVRNDLVHNNGIASTKEIGKCKVLKWFKPGDKIILGMRHVLDFLNQIGFLSSSPIVINDQQAPTGHIWCLKIDKQSLLNKAATVKIISVRIEPNTNPETGQPQLLISVVFDNGVFGDGLLYRDFAFKKGLSLRDKMEVVKKVEIDENGNLVFPNGNLIFAKHLYCLSTRFYGEQSDGKNKARMWGPSIKFRKG